MKHHLKKHGKKIIIGVIVLVVIIVMLHLGGNAMGMIQNHLGM